jgi:hypothetical protein
MRPEALRRPSQPEARRDPESVRERLLRNFVQAQDIPDRCEERACRRFGRCCGIWPTNEPGKTLPCFDRRRELLEPHLLNLFDAMKVYWYGIGSY